MTDIDFYIVSAPHGQEREKFACRLTEKIYRLGHRIHIHTDSADHAARLDDLLWTYRDGSFVPHGLQQNADDDLQFPVVIGHDGEPGDSAEILINLARDVPLFFSRFERVAEIITDDESQKTAGRERFRFYRDRGYPLKTHSIAG